MVEEIKNPEIPRTQFQQLLENAMGVKITYLSIRTGQDGRAENYAQEVSEKDYVTGSYSSSTKIGARTPQFSKELVKQLLQAREAYLLTERSSLPLNDSIKREKNELKLTNCQRAISLMEQGRLTPDSLISTTEDIVNFAKKRHAQTDSVLKTLGNRYSLEAEEKVKKITEMKNQNADRLLDFVANNATEWTKGPQKTE